jgi:hypothetical protein
MQWRLLISNVVEGYAGGGALEVVVVTAAVG